jgi:hypothetical protein
VFRNVGLLNTARRGTTQNITRDIQNTANAWNKKNFIFTLRQRFSNFIQVETNFISHTVLRTALLLSSLKANCLRFSATVCDTQFTLILFFLPFFGTNIQSKRTTRAEPEGHSLRNAAVRYYANCVSTTLTVLVTLKVSISFIVTLYYEQERVSYWGIIDRRTPAL